MVTLFNSWWLCDDLSIFGHHYCIACPQILVLIFTPIYIPPSRPPHTLVHPPGPQIPLIDMQYCIRLPTVSSNSLSPTIPYFMWLLNSLSPLIWILPGQLPWSLWNFQLSCLKSFQWKSEKYNHVSKRLTPYINVYEINNIFKMAVCKQRWLENTFLSIYKGIFSYNTFKI